MTRQHAARGPEDRERFVERFVHEHGRGFERLARTWAGTPEDAADAYQSALLALWWRGPVQSDEDARRWFGTVLMNALRKAHRTRARRPEAELSAALLATKRSPEPEPAELLERRERIARLERIRTDRARVLYLRGLGWSHAEIGATLELSGRQIRKRIEKGRRELRDLETEIAA